MTVTPRRQAAAPAHPAAASRPRGRPATFVRGRWLRTIPGQLRAGTVLVLLAVVALPAVMGMAVRNARDSVQTIGHDAGPQVVATGTLYFALSDMDAQVASVLLIGREHGLGIGYDETLRVYDRRRAEADAAAVQAAQLAARDPDLRLTVQEVLQGLGRYEQLVGEARLLDRQADHPPGRLPAKVVDAYRQATDLMRLELLPKAYNITLDSGANVRRSIETQRSAVLSGRAWVALTGTLVVLLLVAGQVFLARTFRRVLNPALVLATVATAALVAVGTGLLSAQAGHMRTAKEDGFDSILSLSRARAISHSAFGDESRYLLDPARADTYEQTYLDKSLSVLYPDMGSRPVNLENYYATLDEQVGAYTPGKPVPFLGLLGTEARDSGASGPEADQLARTLNAYRTVLDNDRRMRDLAARGDHAGAVDLRMGRTSNAILQFGAFDAAIGSLTGVHRHAFDEAIRDADGGLRGWRALPPVVAAAVALLVVAGVRPRLAEFR
ncbi:hypothetical protein [Actinomadura roseirufa]|uniref:hypothetical protein n=1 Tax=Actinomadura roseirufa TaxID=2094049 RepID=UPI001F5E92E4|nr:hypothetical protein [Actinomadura roseirufa]